MEETLYMQNPWWMNREFNIGIIRKQSLDKLKSMALNNKVTMLLGGRRVGKTFLIYQYIDYLLKSRIKEKNILYLLLDTRAFEDITIVNLLREYRKIHNLSIDEKIYIFLDEIQYKDSWEQEVKNLYDTEPNIQIVLSGSASFKIHTKTSFLTGRYEIMNLYPLNFLEWIGIRGIKILPSESYKYQNELNEYLFKGGYPEYVIKEDPQYFPNLVDSIVYKDFVEYFNIKNLDIVKDLFKLLSDRTGSHSSLSKIGNILSISKETVREYIYALKGSFSVYELQRYSSSRNERIYFAKKYYLNDNGLQFNQSGKFNKGQSAERTLFDYLYKKYSDSIYFYYDNKVEVDFILKYQDRLELIESKYINDISEFNPKSLLKAMKSLDVTNATVITESVEEELVFDEKKIIFIPLWKVLVKQII